MAQVQLDGSLSIGPAAGGSSAVPASSSSVPLSTSPSPKASSVDSGFQAANINSPSSFITLPCVGTVLPLTQCDTLFLRCQQAMQVRITFSATPSDVVSVLYVMGTLFIEAPPASNTAAPNYIKLVEIQGVGIVEYLASGLQ